MSSRSTIPFVAAVFTLLGAAAGQAEIAKLVDANWFGTVAPANAGLRSSVRAQGSGLTLEAESRTQLRDQYWLQIALQYEGPRGTRSVGTKLISSNPRLLRPGNVRIGRFPQAAATLELVGAGLSALRQPATLTVQLVDPGGNRELNLEIRPYQGEVYVATIVVTPRTIYPNDLVNFELRLTDQAPDAPQVTGPLAVNTGGSRRGTPSQLQIAGGLDVHWQLESPECFTRSGIEYSATGLNRVHIDPGNDIARFSVRVSANPECVGSHLIKTWTHNTRTTASPSYLTAAFRVSQRLN